VRASQHVDGGYARGGDHRGDEKAASSLGEVHGDRAGSAGVGDELPVSGIAGRGVQHAFQPRGPRARRTERGPWRQIEGSGPGHLRREGGGHQQHDLEGDLDRESGDEPERVTLGPAVEQRLGGDVAGLDGARQGVPPRRDPLGVEPGPVPDGRATADDRVRVHDEAGRELGGSRRVGPERLRELSACCTDCHGGAQRDQYPSAER
jgi:hypothetical protein